VVPHAEQAENRWSQTQAPWLSGAHNFSSLYLKTIQSYLLKTEMIIFVMQNVSLPVNCPAVTYSSIYVINVKAVRC
jgi:hypothetical protein